MWLHFTTVFSGFNHVTGLIPCKNLTDILISYMVSLSVGRMGILMETHLIVLKGQYPHGSPPQCFTADFLNKFYEDPNTDSN